jgi:hypothetical protein
MVNPGRCACKRCPGNSRSGDYIALEAAIGIAPMLRQARREIS